APPRRPDAVRPRAARARGRDLPSGARRAPRLARARRRPARPRARRARAHHGTARRPGRRGNAAARGARAAQEHVRPRAPARLRRPDPPGRFYERSRRYDEAVALFREAAALDVGLLGETHPTHAGTLTAIGRVLIAAGRLADADTVLDRALTIRMVALGTEHPLV